MFLTVVPPFYVRSNRSRPCDRFDGKTDDRIPNPVIRTQHVLWSTDFVEIFKFEQKLAVTSSQILMKDFLINQVCLNQYFGPANL